MGFSTARFRTPLVLFLLLVSLVATLPTGAIGARPAPQSSPIAQVVQLQFVSLARAAEIIRQTVPHVRVQTEPHSNSLILIGPPDDVQSARAIVQGIDVKNPTRPTVEVVELHVRKPPDLIARLHPLYPAAQITQASKTSLMLRATAQDNAEIKALIASLDAAPATPTPPPPRQVETVDVKQGRPKDVARALAREVPNVRVSVSGGELLLSGDADAISRAKTLAQQLDVPLFGSRYTQIYRLKNVDATSVGDLIARTYPDARVNVDKDLNAVSVLATHAEHDRISDAIDQLDGANAAGGANPGMSGVAVGDGNMQVIDLVAPIPGQNNSPSTSAQDIATAVTQALGQMAPDLHVTVPANSTSIILTGSPTSIRLAKDLIAKLDTTPPLVELDTEVLEIDENAAKDVGLQLPQALLSTTFEEIQPTPDPNGLNGRLGKLQAITRTPLQLTAQLNLLVQHGNGRVLADPRIATLSGHTASFRAGDTLSIITTTGGGVGTPVTQQLQSFNTGVTLDITPIVTASSDIMVTLHPTVNSLSGDPNGVPEIATRDTQTTVHLRDNQTLIIGGLIQEADTKTVSSVPVLGNIPVIGGLFKNSNSNISRNELVIVVTPHILADGETPPPPGASMGIPTPQPLPSLPPDAILPTAHASTVSRTGVNGQPVLHTPIPATTLAPAPTPSAFAASNVFEYGTAPQNNAAQPQDTPQIFYARLSPTVLAPNTNVQVDVVTTTNVTRVTIGTSGTQISLAQVAPGKWRGSFMAQQLSLSSAMPTTQLTLSALRADGFAAAIPVPVSLLAHF